MYAAEVTIIYVSDEIAIFRNIPLNAPDIPVIII